MFQSPEFFLSLIGVELKADGTHSSYDRFLDRFKKAGGTIHKLVIGALKKQSGGLERFTAAGELASQKIQPTFFPAALNQAREQEGITGQQGVAVSEIEYSAQRVRQEGIGAFAGRH
ncbi:MAG: hypothetical protein P8130_11970, partial [Deltaproteobacteria bacterium]